MRETEISKKIGEMLTALAEEHIERIESIAADTADTESDKPVIAKLTANVQWEAGAQNPNIKIGIRYAMTVKDESEAPLDDSQTTIQFGDSEPITIGAKS